MPATVAKVGGELTFKAWTAWVPYPSILFNPFETPYNSKNIIYGNDDDGKSVKLQLTPLKLANTFFTPG